MGGVMKLWSYGALISDACQVYRDPNMSELNQPTHKKSCNLRKGFFKLSTFSIHCLANLTPLAIFQLSQYGDADI